MESNILKAVKTKFRPQFNQFTNDISYLHNAEIQTKSSLIEIESHKCKCTHNNITKFQNHVSSPDVFQEAYLDYNEAASNAPTEPLTTVATNIFQNNILFTPEISAIESSSRHNTNFNNSNNQVPKSFKPIQLPKFSKNANIIILLRCLNLLCLETQIMKKQLLS